MKLVFTKTKNFEFKTRQQMVMRQLRNCFDIEDPGRAELELVLNSISVDAREKIGKLITTGLLVPISDLVKEIALHVENLESSFERAGDQLGIFERSAIRNNVNSLKVYLSLLDNEVHEAGK